ncbi:MAG: hypothetical protein ACXWV9_05805, partial [Flavisolibacter sp.]
TITTPKPGLLFVGIENKVKITHPGYTDDQLKVSITNGEIKRNNGDFLVRVNKPGEAVITVTTYNNGMIELARFELEVKLITPEIANEFKN